MHLAGSDEVGLTLAGRTALINVLHIHPEIAQCRKHRLGPFAQTVKCCLVD